LFHEIDEESGGVVEDFSSVRIKPTELPIEVTSLTAKSFVPTSVMSDWIGPMKAWRVEEESSPAALP
jgi:hypothetical protein